MGGLFWELHQQRKISDARGVAERARKKATGVKSEIAALRAAIDKLVLINRALWEIIAETRGLKDAYLINKVNEIDLRDGTLDGKMITAIRQCPSCGRTLSKKHYKCIYCGVEVSDTDPFATIDTTPMDIDRFGEI